jgi:hypothetical protein
MTSSKSSAPITRLVTYRPKPGSFDALKVILLRHGRILRETGLLTDEPVKVWTATDLRRGETPEPYFVEMFQWKDSAAGDVVHQIPEVMAVWETIGPHVESMTLTTLGSFT